MGIGNWGLVGAELEGVLGGGLTSVVFYPDADLCIHVFRRYRDWFICIYVYVFVG